MPFDANWPPDHAELVSAAFRTQFNGIHDEITTIPKGDPGEKGDQGDPGPQGPPFAQAVVDGVNTGAPGSAAAVAVSFDGTSVHFTFDIPRGDKGDQGDPGEVTQATLDGTIADTARNPAAIGPYTGDFSDPPTQQEMRDFRDWANNFFNATAR